MLSLPREALDASVIPQAGQHFFDAAGEPVFDLGKSGNGIIIGSKMADIAAPQASTKGANGAGAVDWLALGAKAGSQGLSRVYRTETASGKPPATCEGQNPTIQVEYAAQYYFSSD